MLKSESLEPFYCIFYNLEIAVSSALFFILVMLVWYQLPFSSCVRSNIVMRLYTFGAGCILHLEV